MNIVSQRAARNLGTPIGGANAGFARRSPSERSGRALPAALEQLIVDCLAKQQSGRPESATTLLERLRGLDLPPWTQAQALACWSARLARRSSPATEIALARTMAIARRPAHEAE